MIGPPRAQERVLRSMTAIPAADRWAVGRDSSARCSGSDTEDQAAVVSAHDQSVACKYCGRDDASIVSGQRLVNLACKLGRVLVVVDRWLVDHQEKLLSISVDFQNDGPTLKGPYSLKVAGSV